MHLFQTAAGVELFGTGHGDAYYPSNDMDPYLKDNDVSYQCCILSFRFCIFSLFFACLLLRVRMTPLKSLRTLP